MKNLVLLIAFTIICIFSFGQDTTETVKDIEGNVYHTVKIGTQTWMKENLKVTRYNNGLSIPNVQSGEGWSGYSHGAYCWYTNDIFFKDSYGALYNFNSMSFGNLAPKGWHVPSDKEWQILIDYLGGEKIAGAKMKEIGTEHWLPTNDGATNESGFTALPGGYRFQFSLLDNRYDFNYLGNFGLWWTSSNKGLLKSYYISISSGNGEVHLSIINSKTGMSIRCIKD